MAEPWTGRERLTAFTCPLCKEPRDAARKGGGGKKLKGRKGETAAFCLPKGPSCVTFENTCYVFELHKGSAGEKKSNLKRFKCKEEILPRRTRSQRSGDEEEPDRKNRKTGIGILSGAPF